MPDSRASGIICHPTSLPGPYGIGDIGPRARAYADFLAETGQSFWQVLPLGPTGYGESPYMALSAFGGNPLLISLESLVDEGFLDAADIADPPSFDPHRCDYVGARRFKMPLLVKAHQSFVNRHGPDGSAQYQRFCADNALWLDDFALFIAIKEAHELAVWSQWDPAAARRDPDALRAWGERLRDQVAFQRFVQWMFSRQWRALRDYCASIGVRIIGDIPIYVAYDSADVWSAQHLFHLDAKGRPRFIAGVPPDYFSATGQRWGNPIYRWKEMRKNGYRWWIDRFRLEFTKCDIVRIDHFRGFEAYWQIPAKEETAINGRWVKGPGAGLFKAVRAGLAEHGIELKIIAEDLGVITPQVDALREKLGFPGMRILQVAFGGDPKANVYRPHMYPRNCVVYTATHDHNTTVGWWTAEPGTQTTQSAEEVSAEREHVMRYCNCDGREIHWDFIRLALGSVADLAIFPMQDLLGLGTEARMNRPGQPSGNWEWRFTWDMLVPETRERLGELTRTFDRDPRVFADEAANQDSTADDRSDDAGKRTDAV